MTNTETKAKDRQVEACIETERLLMTEIERAMAAITCNQLEDLEDSVIEQQILTARLQTLREQWRSGNSGRAVIAGDGSNGKLHRELVACETDLQALNRIYKSLLERSSHSASLMESLLDSFRGRFQEASGPRLKYQTWSCQM